MSDFDLRKFLAEQKAPKEENIQEVEVNEEELDELRPGYAVGEMNPENNALLQALDILAKKAGATGKKIAAMAKDNFALGKMSDTMKEEEMEETYHEGEDTMEESVIGGIAALVGGTVALGKLLDYLKSKGYELTDPKGKSVIDTTIRGLKKEGEAHEGEEMEEEVNEEELKENAFKSSIKEILNS